MMNTATRVALADENELKPGEMKKVDVDGKKLILANAAGDYYLVDEMCSHEDFSLYLGCIKDKTIKCSLHGSYFDLKTGEALEEPACEAIGTYAVSVSEGRVWFERPDD
ncbi:MAG: non-heme iron oxygenase ferredoxin subunit [Gammaproteobacteria bacterium]|nr:non-heme iron oxygenase ferredoxin subunit [Gammaproteobacteria bacterium]NNJ92826.1 non-heme iron oxygenase ferredoxin subunit [Gammaproteobacteria bacterium]